MSKKNFTLSLALAIVFLVAVSGGSMDGIQVVEASSAASARLPQEFIHLLPAGMSVPDRLPATIDDPILLTGWVYLYNQQEVLRVWEGESLTGREIANSVIDQGVTIQWNTKNECNGSSCTERPVCRLDSSCPAAGDNRGHVDIVIAKRYQDRKTLDLSRLAGTIAHEMIHYLMPFGGADDTLYEEYWAFTVGAQIYKQSGLDFEGFNPLRESCLKIWFKTNDRDYYGYLKPYPPSVLAQADTKTTHCSLVKRLPGETTGFPNGK